MCICCDQNTIESVLHRMAKCERAQQWWNYALSIIYSYCGILPVNGFWPALAWQQCVLGSMLPRRLNHVKIVWSLRRGSTIWLIWIDRNTTTFNNEVWPIQNMHQMLWQAALDLARMNWMRTQLLIPKFPARIMFFLNKFDATWGSLLCLGLV